MELHSLLEIFKRRSSVIIATLISSLIIFSLVLYFIPKDHDAKTNVLIIRSNSDKQESDTEFFEDEVRLVKDPAVVNEVIRALDLRNRQGLLLKPSDLDGAVSVVPLHQAGMIEVHAKARTASDAVNLANTFSRKFIVWSKKLKLQRIESVKKFVIEKLSGIKKGQAEAKTSISDIEKKNPRISIGKDQQSMIAEYTDLEIEKARLDIEIDEITSDITGKRSDNDVSGLVQRREMIDRKLLSFPFAEKGKDEEVYIFQNRRLRTLNSLFSLYNQKLMNLKLEEAMLTQHRIVSDAVQTRGDGGVSVLFGSFIVLMSSLLVTIVAVLLAEFLDITIYETDDIKDIVGSREVAELPSFEVVSRDSDVEWEIKDEEVRRSLSSAVEKCLATGTRVIAIMPCLSDEGKEYVTANIAAGLAAGGKRVVLVDADLKGPTQDKIFKSRTTCGLYEVIMDGKDTIEAVQMTGFKNLSLIPAGCMIDLSFKVIKNEAFRNLLDELKRQYDIILIDCPKLIGATDSADIAAVSDLTLLVVGGGMTTRDALKESVSILGNVRNAEVKCLLSKVRLKGFSIHHQYYRNKKERLVKAKWLGS